MICSRSTLIGVLLIAAACAAAARVQVSIDREIRPYQQAPEMLWIPSGDVLKKLSLGHDGLLANIYWTRVVQYYGGRIRDHKTETEHRSFPLILLTCAIKSSDELRKLVTKLKSAKGVEEDCVVRLPGFLDELPPVADVGAHALILAETEEFLCHVHDLRIDVHRVDRGVRIVPAQEHRQRAAAESDDEEAARFFAQCQPGKHGLRIGQPQILRVARFYDALARPVLLKTQNAQAVFVLRHDDRAEERRLVVQHGLVRARRHGQRNKHEKRSSQQ